MSSKKIWMEVTRDEYELPVKIADSVEELAEMCGTSTNTIRSTISHWKKGRLKTCVYRKVEIEEEESETVVYEDGHCKYWERRTSDGF